VILIVCLGGAMLHAARAADAPAQLVVGEDSIEELLDIPRDLQPGRYEVQCEALITKSGWVSYTICYSMSRWAPPHSLVKAAQDATRKSRFVPATRSGRPAEVYAVLMVIVDTTLHEPLILAVPNNGVETARYGLLYTAPQRYGRLDVRRRVGVSLLTEGKSVVWMELQIDERGVVKDLTLTGEPEVSERFRRGIREALADATFLPGYHEGKPVPMRYVEPYVWQ
jgi:hypothetical protein